MLGGCATLVSRWAPGATWALGAGCRGGHSLGPRLTSGPPRRPQCLRRAASWEMAPSTGVWLAPRPQASAAWPGTLTCYTRSCTWIRWALRPCSAWVLTPTAGQHWAGRVHPAGWEVLLDLAGPGVPDRSAWKPTAPGRRAHRPQGRYIHLQKQQKAAGGKRVRSLTLLGVPMSLSPFPL